MTLLSNTVTEVRLIVGVFISILFPIRYCLLLSEYEISLPYWIAQKEQYDQIPILLEGLLEIGIKYIILLPSIRVPTPCTSLLIY